MLKPEERFALALDAIAPDAVPGSDDLEAEPTDSRALVKAAIEDVMLGVRMAADGTWSASGINTCIRFGRQPTLAQLIQWQDKLLQAIDKL